MKNRQQNECGDGLKEKEKEKMLKKKKIENVEEKEKAKNCENQTANGTPHPHHFQPENVLETPQSHNKPSQQETQQQQTPQKEQKPQDQLEDKDKLIEQLKKENEELKKVKESLSEKLLRAYAEVENTKKFAQKDVENAKSFGLTAFVKDLIEVSDNFELAISSTPKDKLSTNNELKVLFEGISMTNTILHKAFNKHGFHEFKPKLGEVFNPNQQTALFKMPPPANKEGDNNTNATQNPPLVHGTIGAVLKTGFILHSRVIRAAQVGVIEDPNTQQN